MSNRTIEPMMEMLVFETTQLLEQLEGLLIESEEKGNFSKATIDEIFRIMHTIKGSSAMMLLNELSTLAHSLEDIFGHIREHPDDPFPIDEITQQLFLAIDFIRGEMSKLSLVEEADGSAQELIAANQRLFARLTNTEVVEAPKDEKRAKRQYYIPAEKKADEGAAVYRVFLKFEDGCGMENIRAFNVVHQLTDHVMEIFHYPKEILEQEETAVMIADTGFVINISTKEKREVLEGVLDTSMFVQEYSLELIDQFDDEVISPYLQPIEEVPEEPCIEFEEKPTTQEAQKSLITVQTDKLDYLLDLVGEIVIAEAMVIKNPDLEGLSLDRFEKSARQLRKLTDELQDIVMSVRMVPVSATFQKMRRIVRDIAKKQQKEVELKLLGEETEVDKNIIDHLSDPLMHLIRNAMDHGLETTAERLVEGKPDKGSLVIEAEHAGGDVFIHVRDDGRGLDRQKILEKAYEKQLLGEQDPNQLTDAEVFRFILHPGFSTREEVSEYSGRGVGMDVVNRNLEKIGGTILIDSKKGKGTTFSMKIPMTLAIIDGMCIGVGESVYTVPINSIVESIKLNKQKIIEDSDGNTFVMIRGECYPVHRLHRIFDVQAKAEELLDGIIVMVESNKRRACLFADTLIGEQQVVVKPLPNYIKKVDRLAGCTILGDGNISLILDIDRIIG